MVPYLSLEENICWRVWHITLASAWQILRTFVQSNPHCLFVSVVVSTGIVCLRCTQCFIIGYLQGVYNSWKCLKSPGIWNSSWKYWKSPGILLMLLEKVYNCQIFRAFWPKMEVFGCKMGKGVVQCWPPTNSFLLLGIFTSVPIFVHIIVILRRLD